MIKNVTTGACVPMVWRIWARIRIEQEMHREVPSEENQLLNCVFPTHIGTNGLGQFIETEIWLMCGPEILFDHSLRTTIAHITADDMEDELLMISNYSISYSGWI